ncbi:hypothetical protein Tsubulata_021821 [Turnera subulata]|uniref:F-box/kelch-repeat protein n=1 Tax=Turnera subulata TaxID=218843 RepID=A0A9Q0JM01_9ROSI|nr:hypothetical protein Tsubulata_021821 [Turnera subulata]
MYRRPPRSVCFSMVGARREWYTFDLSDKYGITCGPRSLHSVGAEHSHLGTLENCRCLRRPTFCDDAVKEFGHQVGWALLGNHLYCLGRGGTVLAISLFRPEEGWKRRSRMLAHDAHYFDSVVAVRGKLYVLGWGGGGEDQPWAEVYDPVSDSWEPLPEPPGGPLRPEEYFGSLMAGDSEEGYLVFLESSEKLLRYDVEKKSWRCYSNLPRLPSVDSTGRRTICVGHVLYWFSAETGQLHAYDFRNQVGYSSELVDWTFGCNSCSCWDKPQPATLGHLGGKRFCLLYATDPELNPWRKMSTPTSYPKPEPSSAPEIFENKTLLHCLKFRVRLVPQRESLEISLESCQAYLVKAGEVQDGFMV